ncbi:DUF4124 domain-containing protein [Alcanivorax sp.]|jgi:hypothetical protein|uniref:DUF4124 domain-containing protein n=1 Tax=Alcanivorax sp. TaxID=1872427 RepID=UPI0032D8E824
MKIIGVILLSLAAMSASAEIYRWKDANGNWQFGDKAPESQHETIDVKSPPKIGQDEAQAIHARTQRLLESQRTQVREKAQAEEEARRRHQERFAKPCQEAQDRLQMLKGPFEYIEEDGSRRGALPDEVAADQRKTQKWIEEHCDF